MLKKMGKLIEKGVPVLGDEDWNIVGSECEPNDILHVEAYPDVETGVNIYIYSLNQQNVTQYTKSHKQFLKINPHTIFRYQHFVSSSNSTKKR